MHTCLSGGHVCAERDHADGAHRLPQATWAETKTSLGIDQGEGCKWVIFTVTPKKMPGFILGAPDAGLRFRAQARSEDLLREVKCATERVGFSSKSCVCLF